MAKCHCDYCTNDKHANFKGYHPEDELDVNYKKRAKAKPRPPKGCPENGSGPHIYGWVEYRYQRARWWDGLMVTEICWYETCIGCGKVKGRRYNWSGRNRPADVIEVRKHAPLDDGWF